VLVVGPQVARRLALLEGCLVVRRVHDRVLVFLRKHRYLDARPAEERGNDTPEPLPIAAFAALALAAGTFIGRPFAPKEREGEDLDRKEPRFSARHNGFDVHCAVHIAADDDEGRERLIRYCARPPFALSRIEELKDGCITYAMKTPRRGSTHRVMTPVEFMARLSILVPPPWSKSARSGTKSARVWPSPSPRTSGATSSSRAPSSRRAPFPASGFE
jgi:hypothetical protein